MSRRLAFVQIVLGLLGLVGCILIFVRFARPWRDSVIRLGQFAESTQAELELAINITKEGEGILESFKSAAEANRSTLREGQRSLDAICENFSGWQFQLRGLSQTAEEASRVSDGLARVLPFELPVLSYQMEKLRFGIPAVKLQEQIVNLPYPTAKLGSRKESVDLGIAKFDVNVPTLDLGTAERQVTIPANPDVSIESRELDVPSDFKIDKQPLLIQEKQVLQRISNDLRNASSNLDDSASALLKLEKLVGNEVRSAIISNDQALTQSIDQLDELKNTRLPEFQSKLDFQRIQLKQSQPVFHELAEAIPWAFALISILPISLVVLGLWMLSQSTSL